MKRLLFAMAALVVMTGPALAGSCPKHMAAIDAALAKNPQLSAAERAEVTKARADGEAAHKAGKHDESLATLAKAEKILKIN
ncbi:MAG: hypothetical protein FJX68_18175 [Alphaproteobacteria bacterium]|nr:hypothetical protein [Alphaproteobacteria bacterium]